MTYYEVKILFKSGAELTLRVENREQFFKQLLDGVRADAKNNIYCEPELIINFNEIAAVYPPLPLEVKV